MELSEIWIGIIIPIVIGPIFIYLKTLRDDIAERRYKRRREKYENKLNICETLLQDFYWPLYISLISIKQYNYHIPIKNKFRYDSDSDVDNQYYSETPKHREIDLDKEYKIRHKSKTRKTSPIPQSIESDDESENYEISINIVDSDYPVTNTKYSTPANIRNKNITLDKNTIELIQENLESQYSIVEDLIKKNITKSCVYQDLDTELIQFLKYIKIRKIINEGSVHQTYNIKYFGLDNNLDKLIQTTQIHLKKLKNYYSLLINNPI